MYTDPVAGMVETTQEEAGRRGLTNIHFRQCSADDLPFADRTFDAAVSNGFCRSGRCGAGGAKSDSPGWICFVCRLGPDSRPLN